MYIAQGRSKKKKPFAFLYQPAYVNWKIKMKSYFYNGINFRTQPNMCSSEIVVAGGQTYSQYISANDNMLFTYVRACVCELLS